MDFDSLVFGDRVGGDFPLTSASADPRPISAVFNPATPPLLKSLTRAAVFTFLRDYETYLAKTASSTTMRPLPLMRLVDSGIMRGLAKRKWRKPLRDVTDADVQRYLAELASPADDFDYISMKTVEAEYRRRVRLDLSIENAGARALKLVSDFDEVTRVNCWEPKFEGRRGEKRAAKLLLDCLHPTWLRERIKEVVEEKDEYSVDGVMTVLEDMGPWIAATKESRETSRALSGGAPATTAGTHRSTSFSGTQAAGGARRNFSHPPHWTKKPANKSVVPHGAKLRESGPAVGVRKTTSSGSSSRESREGMTSSRPPLTCFGCKNQGHVLRDCGFTSDADKKRIMEEWSAKRRQRGPTRDREANMIRRMDARPDADITFPGGVRVRGCLDTGASVSVISRDLSSRLLREARDQVRPEVLPEREHFRLATEASCSTASVLWCPVTLDTAHGRLKSVEIGFYVLDGVREPLIGRSDMVAAGVDIEGALRRAVMAASVEENQDDEEVRTLEDSRHGEALASAETSHVEGDEDAVHDVFRLETTPGDTDKLESWGYPPEDKDVIDIGDDQEAELQSALAAIVEDARENGLPDTEVAHLKALLGETKDVWRVKLRNDPPASCTPLKIHIKPGTTPIGTVQRRWNDEQRQYMKAMVGELERCGLVRRNVASRWASPVIVTPRANVGPGTPLLKKYRLVVDLRRVNAVTVPMKWPMPLLDTLLVHLRGSSVFACLDLFNGYWQMPLEESSQEFHSFQTDTGVYTPTRVIQGCADGTQAFQAMMTEVLDGLIYDICLVWLDDVVVFAPTISELWKRIRLVLERIREGNLHASATKTKLFMKEAKWCGKLISGEGVRHDPDRLKALGNIPRPENAGQLLQYLASLNWMRASIPDYSRRTKLLYDLLEFAMRGKKSKKVSVANRVPIRETWTVDHDKAFEDTKVALRDIVTLAHRDPEKRMCLFTDASDDAWGAVLTQVRAEEWDRPPKDMGHEPLAFISGMFKGSSKRWPTVEKEGFAIKASVERLDYFLRGIPGDQPFSIYTDHRNLVYIFDAEGRGAVHRHTAERLERWSIVLASFRYRICHVDGEQNVWADLLSRWGAGVRAQEDKPAAGAGGPARLAKLEGSIGVDALSATREEFPTVHDLVIATEAARKRGSGPGKAWNLQDGLCRDDQGRIWVPDEEHLRMRLLVVAHQGGSGHRGQEETMREIRRHFSWEGLADDVKKFVQECLHCVSVGHGKRVPRPLATALHASGVNEVLHFDFLYMEGLRGRTSKTTEPAWKYVLVLKDDFSGFVELVPSTGADSSTTVTALLDWFKRFGIVQQWVSDQGSHFMNEVMAALRERLRCDHHFTVAYAPWSNGTVERVNREVLRTSRALLQEWGLRPQDWPSVLPIVQSCLNAAGSRRLNGLSAVQVFLGREVRRPLDTLFGVSDAKLKSRRPITPEEFEAWFKELQDALERVHKEVDSTRSATRTRPGEQEVNFGIGDFVMLAKPTRVHGNKLSCQWRGPMRVRSCASPLVFEVEDLVSKDVVKAHAERLKLYHDKSLKVTKDLEDFVRRKDGVYEVEAIREAKTVDGQWKFRVSWMGFAAEEDTWEDCRTMFEDIPEEVKRFVECLPKGADRKALKRYLGL